MQRPFAQVDVFTTTPYAGNPVAVVLDGSRLSTEQMQRFAHWTNLSETTFVLPPSTPDADYRVRIFTPVAELPFAGHPTLGTCHAWLGGGGEPRQPDAIVQECGAGLVPIRRTPDGLAFAAPPLLRSGPVEESLVGEIASALGIDRGEIVDAAWADNGPGWVALMLESADAVLALRPEFIDLDVGVVGPRPEHSAEAFEVRAFFPKDGVLVEDPGDRQPQRVARAVDAGERACGRALRRASGDGARARGARPRVARRRRPDLGRRRHGDVHCRRRSSCSGPVVGGRARRLPQRRALRGARIAAALTCCALTPRTVAKAQHVRLGARHPEPSPQCPPFAHHCACLDSRV